MNCDAHANNKRFPDQLVREMLRALGITTCPRCYRVIAIASKRGWIER